MKKVASRRTPTRAVYSYRRASTSILARVSISSRFAGDCTVSAEGAFVLASPEDELEEEELEDEAITVKVADSPPSA